METLFNDNSKANSQIRKENISFLISKGFCFAGTESRSGKLELFEKKTKVTLSFGERCNIAGKPGHGNKYFTLSKDFKSKIEAIEFFNSIKDSLSK